METPIKGGYILLSRKLIESEIFKKPPLYLKVWIYILSKAQHKQYKQLEKGQLFTSIPEIQEACSHMVGYRKETPTKDQIFNILEWLRKRCEDLNESNERTTMITTAKATHGLLISIDKYTHYQNPKNYESNDANDNEKETKDKREQRQSDNINKNVNNDNKRYIDHFDVFYKVYPKKVGKEPARKAFAKLRADEEMLNKMISAINNQMESRQWQDKQFIPNPSTWLNQRRWEDQLDENNKPDGVIMLKDGTFKF